MQLLVIYVAVV